jgi:sugar/nucleoside kinase (ribokinase family)
MEKNGIIIAGTIIVDKLNKINRYPKVGELTKITGLSRAVGGCVPNTAVDIKVINPDLPVYACGKIGADDEGKFVLQTLNDYGVDTQKVIVDQTDRTSFTDVMSIVGGERTFFNYPGTSATFGYDDIEFDKLTVKMLHLGYFLLLDKVDEGDGLKILKKAKELGIKTSIDLVSENSDRYAIVRPCLEYTDNLIINELEASAIAEIPYDGTNIREIATKLKSLGVKERVIIHMPKVGVCLSNEGYTEVNSFKLPDGYIKGATGAGDAFCAGALNGIYKGYSDKEILEFASSCAAVSLREADAVSGLMSETEIKEFCKQFKRA